MGFYRWSLSHYSSSSSSFVCVCVCEDLCFLFCCFTYSCCGLIFSRGNGASVARIIPYAALHYMTYEQYRRWIIHTFPNFGRGPVLDLVAGSFAGGTAVLFTYPLDLVRTKLAYQVNKWSLFLSTHPSTLPPKKIKNTKAHAQWTFAQWQHQHPQGLASPSKLHVAKRMSFSPFPNLHLCSPRMNCIW